MKVLLFFSVFLLLEPILANRCHSFYFRDPLDVPIRRINSQLRDALYGTSDSDAKLVFYWVDLMGVDRNRDWIKREFPDAYWLFPAKLTMDSYRRFYEYRSTFVKKKSELHPEIRAAVDSFPPLMAGVRMDHVDSIREKSRAVLLAFLENYKGKTSPAITKAIEDLHSLISDVSDDRLGFGYVATDEPENGGVILGTFRIFSGGKNHSDSTPLLPMEQSFLKDKVNPPTLKKLGDIRSRFPNKRIYEVGSHSINIPEHLDQKLANRVRTILDLFYLRYYLKQIEPNSLFYSHVLNPLVARKNSINYGMKTVDRVEVPNQEQIELVQEATAADIISNLSRRYGIDASGPLPPVGLYPRFGDLDFSGF